MPVRKLRSITDQPEPPPPASPADNLRAAFDLVELCRFLHPWEITRGYGVSLTFRRARRTRSDPSSGRVGLSVVAEVDRAGGRRADVPGRLVQHVRLDR
jgi:hypothetical protein